uniref:Uncharacterized protein n=1 Tax=Rhizophora mucronata TaxID=61149 RepID=A0A2P2NAQ9_RHIMU
MKITRRLVREESDNLQRLNKEPD